MAEEGATHVNLLPSQELFKAMCRVVIWSLSKKWTFSTTIPCWIDKSCTSSRGHFAQNRTWTFSSQSSSGVMSVWSSTPMPMMSNSFWCWPPKASPWLNIWLQLLAGNLRALLLRSAASITLSQCISPWDSVSSPSSSALSQKRMASTRICSTFKKISLISWTNPIKVAGKAKEKKVKKERKVLKAKAARLTGSRKPSERKIRQRKKRRQPRAKMERKEVKMGKKAKKVSKAKEMRKGREKMSTLVVMMRTVLQASTRKKLTS